MAFDTQLVKYSRCCCSADVLKKNGLFKVWPSARNCSLPGKCLWQQPQQLPFTSALHLELALVKGAQQRNHVPEVPPYASVLSSATLYLL